MTWKSPYTNGYRCERLGVRHQNRQRNVSVQIQKSILQSTYAGLRWSWLRYDTNVSLSECDAGVAQKNRIASRFMATLHATAVRRRWVAWRMNAPFQRSINPRRHPVQIRGCRKFPARFEHRGAPAVRVQCRQRARKQSGSFRVRISVSHRPSQDALRSDSARRQILLAQIGTRGLCGRAYFSYGFRTS